MPRVDWNEFQRLYDSGLPIRQVCSRLKCSLAAVTKARRRKAIKLRTLSEASKFVTRPRCDDKTKKAISDSQKRAHAEGRAYNIGRCRWRKTPSFPERFFMTGLEIHRIAGWVRELWFNGFVIDFAWPKLKLAIEIDGQQHERFQTVKDRANPHAWPGLWRRGWLTTPNESATGARPICPCRT